MKCSRGARICMLLLPALLAGCTGPDAHVVEVTLAEASAANPTVAVDDRTGIAYAAWIETAEDGSNVYLARIDSGGRTPPVRVNDIAGDAAPHDQAPPQVATGPDGSVYVVWQNNTIVEGRHFPASNLRFARSSNGGRSFEPAMFVNDDALGPPSSHTFHDVAVAGDGTIHVSWIDGRARTRAEAEAGGTGMHDGDESMPGSEIRVASSHDGGRTFSTGVVVHRNACPCCRTSLAVSGDTAVAVAFRSAEANIRDMLVVRSTDGGKTFGQPVRVHADAWVIDGCPHAGGSLAYDTQGRLHIAWYTGAEERQGLWHAVAPGGGTFGEPTAIQAGGWVPVSQVKLTPARDGSVWVAWDDRRGEESLIRVAMWTPQGMADPVVVGRGRSPAVAAGENVIVSWQQDQAVLAGLLSPP
ncbi:MAG TPA: sialidase family protein [Longimicrobiales bacterium]|nr:sialidase family protein [Longimicrobiales bacterium]